MPSYSKKTLLADTCFWYALFEPRDHYHSDAIRREDVLMASKLFIPWPVLYETFNTRFAKNQDGVRSFESLLNRPNQVEWISDQEYKEEALEIAFRNAQKRGMALVDIVIRMILEDVNVRVNSFLTFNKGDFYDVCGRRNIEML